MRSLLMAACLTLAGCAHAPAAESPAAPAAAPHSASAAQAFQESVIQAVIDAPDRTAADRALDEGRHPAALLEFAGVGPGMKVAELMAGGGYTTELLVRAVGPSGTVYAQNPQFVIERFGKVWDERLARPINAKVIRLDRDFNEPFPSEVKDLDVVISNIIYHDSVWLKADRAKMNAAVFQALKPGGAYMVLDSSARPGAGVSEAQTLHRIEEKTVRDEVLAAGFQLAAESDVWRNPQDARDWNSSPGAAGERRGTSDRFALKFIKPR